MVITEFFLNNNGFTLVVVIENSFKLYSPSSLCKFSDNFNMSYNYRPVITGTTICLKAKTKEGKFTTIVFFFFFRYTPVLRLHTDK